MSNTSERRSRRKFTDEFKADAVALVEESGGQIAKVAKELGSVTSWEKQRPTSRHATRGTGDGDLFVHR
jgi:transposase-like protein